MPKPGPSKEKIALVKRLLKFQQLKKESPARIAMRISMFGETSVSYQQVYRWLAAAKLKRGESPVVNKAQYPQGDHAKALTEFLNEVEK